MQGPLLVGSQKMQPTRQSTPAKDHALPCYPGQDALALLLMFFSMESMQLHTTHVDLLSNLLSIVCLIYPMLALSNVSADSM